MNPSPPDADVIARSASEPHAFAAIFDRHHDEIHNYLRRRVGPDLADDLASETFVRAFRARRRYLAQHATCRPWLYGIAANLIADQHRAESRRLRALGAEAASRASPGGQTADDIAERAAGPLTAEVAAAVQALKRRDREVLLLYAWADLTYSEIAEALSLPVGTIRSRLNRARSTLATRLGPPAQPTTAPTTTARPGEAHAH